MKKEGIREEFNREKILSGLIRACEKRPVTLKQLENIASEVEKEFRNQGGSEVKSEISVKWSWTDLLKWMKLPMFVLLQFIGNLKILMYLLMN